MSSAQTAYVHVYANTRLFQVRDHMGYIVCEIYTSQERQREIERESTYERMNV